jgi:hypothetical protein
MSRPDKTRGSLACEIYQSDKFCPLRSTTVAGKLQRALAAPALAETAALAALIALGVKDIENRSWRTSYRGPLAVHASRGHSGCALSDIERHYGVSITHVVSLRKGRMASRKFPDIYTGIEFPSRGLFSPQTRGDDAPAKRAHDLFRSQQEAGHFSDPASCSAIVMDARRRKFAADQPYRSIRAVHRRALYPRRGCRAEALP